MPHDINGLVKLTGTILCVIAILTPFNIEIKYLA